MTGIRICIAGYMGAGKSTAAGLVAGSRVPVIDADREAKAMMAGDTELVSRLVNTFGPSILEGDSISFARLGALAFSSATRLFQLNGIVHPPLLARLRRLIDEKGETGCVLDAALASLWGIESWFTFCVWVAAPQEIRLKRILRKMPGQDERQIRLRMELQEQTVPAPRQAVWKVIENSGSPEDLAQAFAEAGVAPCGASGKNY